jgi:hypothetical protein
MNEMNCCKLSATMAEIVVKLTGFAAKVAEGGIPPDTAGDFSAAMSDIAAKLMPLAAAAATAEYEAEEEEAPRSVFEGLQADFEAEAIAAGSMVVEALQEAISKVPDPDDICGFCGLPGIDKYPHPVRWPGEESAGTKFVHSACEDRECARAHSFLTNKQREDFLRSC